MKPADLDELDRKIIARLADDARASNRKIASEFGVAEGTVRARLKRLFDAKAIRFTAITNAALSDRYPAFLWIEVSAQRHVREVVRALTALPEITFVSTLLGRADVLAITLVRDGDELSELIHRQVDGIPGIHRVQWTLGHGYIKHDYGRCAIVD